MRILLLSCYISLSIFSVSGQTTNAIDSSATTDMVNKFILSAEKEGFLLVGKERCNRPSGEMCKFEFSITSELKAMRVMVIGNLRTEPSLAVEDKETSKVITFTSEDDVSPKHQINMVSRQFNLYQTELDIIFHFGNSRSFGTEITYMLVFTQ